MTLAELNKTVFKGKAGSCAKETLKFLVKHYLEEDVCIYVNGYRISYYDNSIEDTRKFDWEKIKVEEDMNPRTYFQWAGDFMSMSFEGPLYDVLNYGFEFSSYEKREEELCNIFKKYGKYYELGNAWNLSLYDL